MAEVCVPECPRCQRENRRGARFCAACGHALSRACAACGATLPEEAAFCDACGAAVGGKTEAPRAAEPVRDPRAYTPRHLADRILHQRGALEGERKHVTVLFADVAGFTALSEARDPEAVHALMDRFFQIVLDEVHRYEGTVNQFLGDGVMALFGAPVALEDAPRRALLAALGIQRGLATLVRDPAAGGAPLPLRIGIHAGQVVVGRIGDDLRMDYTAVGDTTNLAARLQQLAEAGQILISEATRRLVSGFFELEDTGEHRLRGKSEPVRAYRVVRQLPVAGRIDALADTGLTPLVGRDRELAILRDAFESAREGRGRVCFLVGDAGIGKSRLLYEFRQKLAGIPHLSFEGRCASYGSNTAFQSIVDGLLRFFDIRDEDDEAAARAKLARGLAERGEDLAWTRPFLQKLLSMPVDDPAVAALDAVERRSETIRALQALFLRAAEKQALVFAIEDLHWIDPASEEFLELLIDSIPTARACLLLTHRPGYRQPFGDRSYHVRVALQTLSADEMAAMAGSLLDRAALPAELRDLIAKKAEGNPFFVEEVTKSLLEDGALQLVGDRVELARSLDEISVPDSIQDVLMARIDRLDEDPKRAIQVASVIGREFALRLLERIVEAGDAMSAVVGELRSLELIYQKAAHPELAFMFKHALTHDVAYESVLRQRRRSLHSIVGHAIEELYADRLAEHYEALAHHFEQAEEWERALLYRDRAARKAMDAYANRSAAEHFRCALDVARRLGDAVPDEHRRRLAEGLGHVRFCVSEFRGSAESYESAAGWSDPAGAAFNLARASQCYLWGHLYDECEASADRALEIAAGCDCAAATALARHTIEHLRAAGGGLVALGGRDPGSEPSRIALESGDDEAIATVLGIQGIWVEMQGEYRRSIEISRRALRSAQRTGNALSAIIPRWAIGLSQTCMGEYAPALAAFHDCLELCIRLGDRALRSRLLNTLGWFHAELGCHVAASEFNRSGAELAREMLELDLVAGIPEIHFNATVNLACNRIALGDTDEALALLQPVREAFHETKDPWARWRWGMHLRNAEGRAALTRGEPERALALVDEELVEARRQTSPKLEARALELRGRALLHLDRREDAAAALGEALAVARAIGYPPVTWRALSLRSELARRAGDLGEAERCGREATALVTRLAAPLPDAALRSEFADLGRRLASDPLGAYR